MSQSYSQHTVEGIARVVRVEGHQLWLEPEQTTSCGHCASSASCSAHSQEAAGMGTVASRLQARRFMIDAPGEGVYHEGERLVVGIGEQALLRAALTAYGLPLAGALLGGALCQGLYGEDLISMLGMAGGLAIGLLAARLRAGRLAARGELSPRVLRRARPDETCATV